MIHYFVEHRHDVVVRRTKYELRKAEERAHILEGLMYRPQIISMRLLRLLEVHKMPMLQEKI